MHEFVFHFFCCVALEHIFSFGYFICFSRNLGLRQIFWSKKNEDLRKVRKVPVVPKLTLQWRIRENRGNDVPHFSTHFVTIQYLNNVLVYRYGDMRHVMGFELVRMWNSLGKTATWMNCPLNIKSSCMLTRIFILGFVVFLIASSHS